MSHCANSWARMPNGGWQQLGECVCEVVWCIVTVLCKLNEDLSAEQRMETRVSSYSIATLLLQ